MGRIEKQISRLYETKEKLLIDANRAYGDGSNPDVEEIGRLMEERESIEARIWQLEQKLWR